MISYSHGTSTTPLLGDTVASGLAIAVRDHGGCDAVVSRQQQKRLTYAELDAEATRVARSLIALRVQPADRVGIWSTGRVEWVIAQYAAAKVGATLVSLNPAYRAHELEHALAHVGVSVLLTGRRVANNDCAATLARLLPELEASPSRRVRSSRLPELRTIVYLDGGGAPGGVSWAEFIALAEEVPASAVAEREAALGPDDPALILYTSGTTGRPKAVVLSHHAVMNGGFFVGQRLRYIPGDRLCQPLPLYHVLGCVAANVAAMTHGCAVVLPSEFFDARQCLEAIEQERCTAVYGVPTMFIAQLEHRDFARYQLDSLRTGVISGASCPEDVMRRIIDEMHVREITVGYGMTEMAPILYTAVDDSVTDRVSTAGTVQPHVECKIVDPANGRIVLRGVVGELCARGYGRMLGYWGDAAATATIVDRAGWLHTGDLAVMREDGYVAIAGRLKDLIIRGGENISPREIEELLHRHPQVQDAYVVGVPDREYGEEICAWVRLRDGQALSADELRRHCRADLAVHKIPRYVCFATEFPTTPSGKVQKYRLRELATAQLGLAAASSHRGARTPGALIDLPQES